jgi:hypothetical protein
MLPQDKLVVQVTIDRGRRDELVEVAEAHPKLFSMLEIIAPQALPYPNKSLFINYRREDSENVVGRMYDRLAEEFGKGSVFKDVEDILPGVDFRRVLEYEVSCTDVMLVVIGPDWINRKNKRRLHDPNDFVRFEIETALERGIPVIPVLVRRRSRLPQRQHLPASLRDLVYRNAVEIRPDPDFHHDMRRLIQGIVTLFEMEHESPALSDH